MSKFVLFKLHLEFVNDIVAWVGAANFFIKP